MSIYGAMFSGVSGLKAQGANMGMISDNISNVNTVGYKGARAKFQTLVTTQVSTTTYAPGGVQSNTFRDIDKQGLLQASSSAGDIAIVGRGFFPTAGVVDTSGSIPTGTERAFTRAGSFSVDQRGYLTNSAGQYLLGVPTDTAGVPTIAAPRVAQLTAVNVGTLTGIAAGTTELSLGANLPSTEAVSPATAGVKFSGKIPTYTATTLPATAALQTAAAVSIGVTLVGTRTAGTDAVAYPTTLTFTPTAATATTTTYTVSSPTGVPVLAGTTLVLNNTTGAVVTASTTLAFSASAAVADPSDSTLTVDLAAVAAGAMDYTDVVGATGLTTTTTTFGASSTGTVGATTDVAATTHDVNAIVYDSLGVAHTLTFRFTKVSPSSTTVGGTWNVAIQDMRVVSTGLRSTTSTLPSNLGNISFNKDGTIASTTPQMSGVGLTMSTTNASDFKPTLNFGTTGSANGLTQFSDQFAVSFTNQNGVPFGYRTGVSITEDGLVKAVFDNGQQVPLFKIPLVTFANPNGLEPQSGNLYTQSTRSGDAVLNFAGIGGAGTVSPSTLESSTVDLAEEFTNMIITQRSYSAAAKTITTADEMLNEVVNIKR